MNINLSAKNGNITSLIHNLPKMASFYLFILFMLSELFTRKAPFNFWLYLFFTIFIFFFIDYKQFKYIFDLTRLNRQLSYVDQLTQALRKSMKLEEVLNIILGNLTNELGYDRVVIYALETSLGGKQDYLKAMAAYKIDLSKIQDYTLKLDKSIDIVPRAAIEKKSYIVSNAKDDHRCSQEFVELLNLKQYIVLPLIAKDITVGALLADNSINYKSIDEKDLPPLMLFANQAAIAIENAKLYEQIEQLAITDGLTKLHNHRYFQENLRKELSRFDRYDGQQKGLLSILMMDVDWFKHYNDTNGHIAGDTVLIEIGQILKNFTRKVDLVARYGGEEFIMVLPNTTKPGAMLLAERIRKTIEEHPFEFGHSQPLKKVTVTIGVSTYRDDAMTQEELIACADKGLYIGKEAGRNRVCYVNQPADSDQ